MTKPPIKKLDQSNYVKSAVRFPPDLRDELHAAADRHGRSFNAEVIARLQASPLDAVMAELAEMKHMMRLMLDQS